MKPEIDFTNLYADLPWNKRVALFFKMNHYVFWKVTLMDITIVLPLFMAIFYICNARFTLVPLFSFLVPGVVCGLILFFRIKLRRLKSIGYMREKIDTMEQFCERFEQMVRQAGSEEDEQTLEYLKQLIAVSKDRMDNLAEIAFKEDILGYNEDEGDD